MLFKIPLLCNFQSCLDGLRLPPQIMAVGGGDATSWSEILATLSLFCGVFLLFLPSIEIKLKKNNSILIRRLLNIAPWTPFLMLIGVVIVELWAHLTLQFNHLRVAESLTGNENMWIRSLTIWNGWIGGSLALLLMFGIHIGLVSKILI